MYVSVGKIFGENEIYNLNRTVTFDDFCKSPLDDYQNSFWEWFYEVTKLIRDRLRSFWEANLIIGFITRLKAEQLISESPQGFFVIRFTNHLVPFENERGKGVAAISLVYKKANGFEHTSPSEMNYRTLPNLPLINFLRAENGNQGVQLNPEMIQKFAAASTRIPPRKSLISIYN